jgi:uncharacterized membrane protein
MLAAWIGSAALAWRMGSDRWDDVLTIGFAHVLAGRGISIAQGTYVGLPQWMIVLLATYADVTLMMIIFPLFVYTYENFIESRLMQKRMQPMLSAARKGVGRIGRYKVVGIFFFVWTPLWMTGIIIGAILGYLLGLPTWLTLTTVILGALTAVSSWVYAYDIIFGWLSAVHQEIPLVATILLVVGVAVYRLWKKRQAP